MGEFLSFLGAVGRAIWGVWTLDTSTAEWFRVHPLNLQIAVTIAVLAGASTLFGDSVVLFFNRVRGWRFAFTLLLNGFAMVVLYALQALVVTGIGHLLLGRGPGLAAVTRGVMLATAPLVFGLFALVPYFGPAIARLLQAWGMVALWVINTVLFDTGIWFGLAITATGWAVMQGLSWAFSRPVAWLGERVWRLVSGRPFMLTGQDLLSGHLLQPLGHQFDGEAR